ncbi:DUF63 family protein [Haloferax namakaokahaiae]|uniref:DUF63 family protein n=1 Tax=Haloferax namakaokahaiae TaxID=1748331 RepID=A0ABD5ZAN1_9EURY
MAILPEGFALPPLPYLVVLVAGLVGVGVGFSRRRPTVSADHVLALVPWMVAGSALHVQFVTGLLPPIIEPFAGTPAVYLSVTVLAGLTWLGLDSAGAFSARLLAILGVGFAALLVGITLVAGYQSGTLSIFWPAVGFFASVVVAPLAWGILQRIDPKVSITGPLGVLAIFGHTLDAVSTAVGIDVLGFGERTPLSQVILDVGAALPTAGVLGVGWFFVLVKVAIASLVVVFLADLVRDDPTEGSLLLGFVAAVGLGPGVHNLLLFAVSGV